MPMSGVMTFRLNATFAVQDCENPFASGPEYSAAAAIYRIC